MTDISVGDSGSETESSSSASLKLSLSTEQRGDIKTRISTEVEMSSKKKSKERSFISGEKTRRKPKTNIVIDTDSTRRTKEAMSYGLEHDKTKIGTREEVSEGDREEGISKAMKLEDDSLRSEKNAIRSDMSVRDMKVEDVNRKV